MLAHRINLADIPPFVEGRQLLRLPVSIYFQAHQSPSEKEFTLKAKNFLPGG